MAGNWLIFVHFGEEFVLLARNLYVLARRECPGEENFDFFSGQPCPSEENFDFFLASPTLARINSRFFLAGVFPCHKYLLPDDP